MAYWACARLEQNRVELGLHFLALAGFETYTPRIKVEHGANGTSSALLFAPYSFVSIELQWTRANRSPGVVGLIMHDERPARVPDRVVTELRARERDGFVQLPAPPIWKRGDRLKITRGLFTGHFAIFESMQPHERVEVLLAFLGSERRLELARRDVMQMR